jgi:malonyl CoA-acyl carrier protein transacylase
VDWAAGAVRLLTEARPWPETGRPRRAAVSSFGVSGTNAHVIVEAFIVESAAPEPDPQATAPPETGLVPWVLSGRGAAALRAQADRLRRFLAESAAHPVHVGWSLLTTRATFDHRAVVLGADKESLLSGLASLPVTGVASPGRLGVVFAGQGSQRAGAGRELYKAFPVFAAAWDEVAERLGISFDLDDEALARTGHAQPVIFAIEVALFRLFESFGVKPDYLAGHSIGEIAAAHLAGVLSLGDACVLVAARARLMQALPPGGAMVAVQATEGEVLPLLAGHRTGIAAINGPSSIVVSGAEEDVGEVVAALGERKSKRLRVSHAFHSPLMDPMLDEFRAVATALSYAQPEIPLVLGGDPTDPEYWVEHVRQPVRFLDTVRALETNGVTTVLELGPDAVLSAMITDCANHPDMLTAVPTLRRDRDDTTALLTALAGLWVRGRNLDWSSLFPEARPVELPTYAFQRQRYWVDVDLTAPAGRAQAPVQPSATNGGAALHERLLGLPPIERERALAEVIRAELGGVLGHPADRIETHRTFSELGVNSLTAAELRTRLVAITGLPLPAAAVFDHPNVTSLARFLAADLAVPPGETASGGRPPLVELFQRACAAGRASEGIELLAAAANVRDAGSPAVTLAEPVRFTRGAGKPSLLCLPSLVAPANAYQFARFAEAFRDERALGVLAPPGYQAGEPLPGTLATVVRAHVDAVRAHAPTPPVLVGYSSGGWLAHAVATALAEAGRPPAGVVLLDSYLPDSADLAELQVGLYRRLAAKPELVDLVDDTNLTAMGRYLRLFAGWTPRSNGVPTLLVAAASFTTDDPGPSTAVWPLPHTRVIVPGDHVSMVEEHAADTAGAVDKWLTELAWPRIAKGNTTDD